MKLFANNKAREIKNNGRSSGGAKTKRKILAHAMGIAAREGLAGLTIGRLARELGMSKSGLFAHFRSKRALEMATITEARNVFASQVLSPAKSANEGIEQLWVLCNLWLAHIEHRVFSGGYFFTGAFFECAERTGPIEEEINRMAQEWWAILRNAAQKAQDRKEIDSNLDVRRISFDLNGILMATYWTYLIEKDNEIFSEARIALQDKLKQFNAAQGLAIFKMKNDWRRYLKKRYVDEQKQMTVHWHPEQRNKVQSSAHFTSTPSQVVEPLRKSESVFFHLTKLRKR